LQGPATSKEHEESSDRVAEIFDASGFIVDREVNVEVRVGKVGEKFNLDVCAVHKEGMVIVEVKTERSVDFKQEILGWSKKREKLTNFTAISVESSRRNRIGSSNIRKIRSLAIVILSTRDKPKQEHSGQASASEINFWGPEVLRYYGETAKTLGSWTKYEIMRDLRIQPREIERPIVVPALKVEQPGGACYSCVMSPRDLLRIAYVYRRSKMDTLAYQRVVRQGKIESMNVFLRQKNASLPNNIIVAIDNDISNKVDFNDGKLTIPGNYSSAWIVDGQHRLYGFMKTKYKDENTIDRFELPVMVYHSLDSRKQAAMFVDINNNQKKIDPTLLADLSTVLQDISKKETWPSILAKKLAESGPFKGLVRITEITTQEEKTPITLAGIAKGALIRYLLAPKISKGKITDYTGPLFRAAQFNWHHPMSSRTNRDAMAKQLELVNAYFGIVKGLMGRKWTNTVTYGLTSYTGINALFLVFNKILETGKSFEDLKIGEFLKPLPRANISWTKKGIRRYSNFPGFRELANKMIMTLNKVNDTKLDTY